MDSNILVSILCITYNQVEYVKDMLDGFLSQETDFGFEVLVHDDASTDGTVDVIKEYENKYDNVHLYSEEVNRFSEGINYINELLLPNALGKYIAICEGDDYWCSNEKLAKQVGYMEGHPGCSLCTTRAFVRSGDSEVSLGYMGLGPKDRVLSPLDLAREWHLPTASFLFRKSDAQEYARNWTFKTPVGDFPRAFYLATKGHVSYLAEPMTVYRYGVSGSWTKTNEADERRLISEGLKWLKMLDDINEATKGIYLAALVESAKSKVIRLYGRGVMEYPGTIANIAFDGLSTKQRIVAQILALFWGLGFDFKRAAWSGLKKWRIVRRSAHEFA